MANSNNWGEIYKSTWWGDEDWSANSLKIDSAPPGFAGQNLLLGSEELDQSDVGEWVRLNINAVDANVAGVANPLSSDETVEKVDFQASPTSRIIQDVTLVAGTQYTFSVWAKSAGASNEQFRLRYWDRTAASGGGDLFTALTTDWSPTSGRYSFTFTAASSGVHAMHIQNSGSDQRRIYFWGAMLNEGATAGDYIKTEFTPQPSNPPTAPMEFGDNFVGVTAYYSLRRFTTGEDNNAIRVRRSSDDTEQDIGFDSNGDLDTTALLAFVNADYNAYTSDFSSTEDLGEVNGTGAAAQSVGGVDDAYKFTLSGGSGAHIAEKNNLYEYGKSYTVSFDYYIPSGQTVTGLVAPIQSGNTGSTLLNVTGSWQNESIDIVVREDGVGNSNDRKMRFYAHNGVSATVDADGDVFYLKNIVVTQTTADGAVTTFYDQTGNGNDATNATESEQPLVVSGGTLVEENSKAALEFDGADDYLIGAAKTTMDNTAIFSVIKSDSNTQDSVFIQNTLDGNNLVSIGLGGIGTSNAIGSRLRVAGATADSVGDSTFTATDQTLVSYIADNTAGQMFVDGTEETDAVDSRSAAGITTIGARGDGVGAFNGAIQEIIFFDSDQSSNRTGMETNINDHFDIYTP